MIPATGSAGSLAMPSAPAMCCHANRPRMRPRGNPTKSPTVAKTPAWQMSRRLSTHVMDPVVEDRVLGFAGMGTTASPSAN